MKSPKLVHKNLRSLDEILREVLSFVTNDGVAADGVDLPEDLIEEAYAAIEEGVR